MEQTYIPRYYANSLEQVIKYVDHIGNICRDQNFLKPLWFRGHEYTHYYLTPNIFRKAEYHYNGNKTYSNNHLREHYRYQHFMSRNFDKNDYREPRSVFEWQEVMQHFFAKTRLMDWSESLFTALEFALEAYLIPYKDLEISSRRRRMQPILWILLPSQLNDHIYDVFAKEEGNDILNKVLSDIDSELRRKIKDELDEKNKNIYFSSNSSSDDETFNHIVSLTALEDLKHSYMGREKEALKRMEFNPFFYLLLRIYADGVPVNFGTVPPLAIIHPYHSQRIRAQKGVFTVFPHYILGEKVEKLRSMKIGYDPIAMEYMPKCQDCLYQIKLTNPSKIAEQLRQMGYKGSDLYPDSSQKMAQEMENMDYTK